jgi:hypothetical protein
MFFSLTFYSLPSILPVRKVVMKMWLTNGLTELTENKFVKVIGFICSLVPFAIVIGILVYLCLILVEASKTC